MTLLHPESSEPEVAECANCGNDSFKVKIRDTSHGAARIVSVECAICTDLTEFVKASPEDFN